MDSSTSSEISMEIENLEPEVLVYNQDNHRMKTRRPPNIPHFAATYSLYPMYLPEPDDNKLLHSTIYCNEALLLKRMTTLAEIEQMMLITINLRDSLRRYGFLIEAAVAALWVVQHRVMILQEGASVHRKTMAIKSFPRDVAGKWCYPDGDLLVFPGFSNDARVLRDVIRQMYLAVMIAKKLAGPVTGFTTKITPMVANSIEQNEVNYYLSRMSCRPELGIGLIFKPIFSGLCYHISGAKPRLLAELYQAAILVFFKLSDWALFYEDLGTAMYFVHLMRLSTMSLQNILPNGEDLETTYLVTMGHWVFARCYYSIYRNYHNLGGTVANFNKIKKKLGVFVTKFFYLLSDANQLKQPYDCISESYLSDVALMKQARAAYFAVSIPKKWTRSVYEKQAIDLQLSLYKLCHWTASLTSNETSSIIDKKNELKELQDDLELTRHQKNMCPQLKMMADLMAAKWAKLHQGMHVAAKANKLNFWQDDDIPELRSLYFRTFVQHKAMSAMNLEEDSNEYPDLPELRAMTAMNTLFDEVIFVFEGQWRDLDSWNPVDVLIYLLPMVVQSWKGFGNLKPQHQLFLNSIMAMFFYGLARGFQIVARKDPSMLANMKYCFPIAARLMRKVGALVNIVRAFLDHAHRLEICCFYGSSKGPLENMSTRAMHVLRRLTWLLPIFDETLLHDGGQGMVAGYYDAVLETPHLFPPELIDKVPDMLDAEKAVFGDFMKFVERVIGFEPSDSGVFVVLENKTDDSGVKTLESGDYVVLETRRGDSVGLHRNNLKFKPFKVTKPTDNEFVCVCSDPVDEHPPVAGVPEQTTRSCPIEAYYDEEEITCTPKIHYTKGLYYKIFYDVDLGPGPSDCDNLEILLQQAKSILLKIIGEAVIDLQSIVDNKLKNDQIEKLIADINVRDPENQKGFVKHHKPGFLLSEFRALSENLASGRSGHPVVNSLLTGRTALLESVTIALFKLDQLLNNGELGEMLRIKHSQNNQ